MPQGSARNTAKPTVYPEPALSEARGQSTNSRLEYEPDRSRVVEGGKPSYFAVPEVGAAPATPAPLRPLRKGDCDRV